MMERKRYIIIVSITVGIRISTVQEMEKISEVTNKITDHEMATSKILYLCHS